MNSFSERYAGPIISVLFGAVFIAAGADMSDGVIWNGEPFSDPNAAINVGGPFWFTLGVLLAGGGVATAVYRTLKRQ